MRMNARNDVQIAVFAAGGLLAASFEADAGTVGDAGRDLDLDGFDLAIAIDLQGQGRAAGGLQERKIGHVLDVRGALRRGAGAGAASRSIPRGRSSEKLIE